jgi:hypothetical protein
MSRKTALAAFFAGRAARIILAGSNPADAPDNTAAQVSDIIVSNLVVREDASNGLVGYLYAVGTTAPVVFTITSDPDGIFAIVNGNELHKADAFGTGTDYAITIKATETVGGAEYSEEFTVDVIPAETVVPDPPVGDGGGSGDVVIPDEEDPDSDTDPYVQEPVEVVTEIASKVSGKTGGTSVFLKDWGVPEAGGVNVLKYSADWSGMSAQGRYAAVGFGFKQGQNFHMTGLRGNGAVMTTMLASRLYGDFRKAKQFSITNDGAAENGTRSGPNWLRLTIAEDGASYTLETSADGETWEIDIEDAAPSPFTDATDATQFGPAAYFYEEDKGAFVISISEFVLEPQNSGSGATVLAEGEANALVFDFTDETFVATTGRYGAGYIVDVGTPANDYDSDGHELFLSSAENSIKYLLRADGTLGLQNHNLALYSDDLTGAAWSAGGSPGTTVRTANTIEDTSAAEYGYVAQTFNVTSGVSYELSFRVLKASATGDCGAVGLSDNFLTSWFAFGADDGTTARDGALFVEALTTVDLTTHWRFRVRFVPSSSSHEVRFYPNAGTGPAGFFATATKTGTMQIDQIALRRHGASGLAHLTTTSAAKIDLPIDHDTSGNPIGLLVEPSRKNHLDYTEAFDNGAWVADDVTVTANSVAAPDGDTEADTLAENTANSDHYVYQTTSDAISSGTTYTCSIYAKAGTATVLQIGGTGLGFDLESYANFNLSNGTVGSVGTSTTARIEALPNSWYRCIMSAPANGTTSTPVFFALVDNNASAARGLSYTGSSRGLYIWGAQLEPGAYATSYVPNLTTTNNTRPADALTLATSRYPHSATVNSAMIRYRPFNVASAMVALRWDDGTSNEVVSVGHTAAAALNLTVTDGGAAQTAPLTSGTATAHTWEKVAVSWKAADFLISDNGAAAAADTSGTLPTVTSLDIGPTLAGHISHILVVPAEKSAAEVAAMAAA